MNANQLRRGIGIGTDDDDDQHPVAPALAPIPIQNYGMLQILYDIGFFLIEFILLAKIFSYFTYNHTLIIIAIILWKFGGAKGWILEKCNGILHPRLVYVLKSVIDCFVYIVKGIMWLCYTFFAIAARIFCFLFLATIVIKSYELTTKQRILPF